MDVPQWVKLLSAAFAVGWAVWSCRHLRTVWHVFVVWLVAAGGVLAIALSFDKGLAAMILTFVAASMMLITAFAIIGLCFKWLITIMDRKGLV